MTKHIKDKQELMDKIVSEYSIDIELLHELWDMGYDRGIEVGEKEIKERRNQWN